MKEHVDFTLMKRFLVYKVDSTGEARKNINALSDKDRKKVQKAINRVLENPY